MAVNSAPFRGNLPQVSKSLGGTTPEIAASNLNKTLTGLQKDAQRGKDASDVGPNRESVRGGDNTQTVQVAFKKANFPLFISHDFGYTVRNWAVVDKDASCDIWRPTGKKYIPSDKGIWLVCDMANVSARIRLDGQKGVA